MLGEYLSPKEMDMTTATFNLAPQSGTSTPMARVATDTTITDISKSGFPFQMVMAIVLSTVSAVGAVWATQSRTDTKMNDMQSDIRVILAQQAAATDMARMREDTAKSERDLNKEEVKAIKAQQSLLQLQLQAIQLELAKGKR
jgi:hypothetical protein